jgi:hypothetical protein
MWRVDLSNVHWNVECTVLKQVRFDLPACVPRAGTAALIVSVSSPPLAFWFACQNDTQKHNEYDGGNYPRRRQAHQGTEKQASSVMHLS